jgi:hypothetical protein
MVRRRGLDGDAEQMFENLALIQMGRPIS